MSGTAAKKIKRRYNKANELNQGIKQDLDELIGIVVDYCIQKNTDTDKLVDKYHAIYKRYNSKISDDHEDSELDQLLDDHEDVELGPSLSKMSYLMVRGRNIMKSDNGGVHYSVNLQLVQR